MGFVKEMGGWLESRSHYAPKTSHKKAPPERGLVAEKTCDTLGCYQARPGKVIASNVVGSECRICLTRSAENGSMLDQAVLQ